MRRQSNVVVFVFSFLSIAIFLMSAGTRPTAADWLDRMAVPLVAGDDFAAMRDASLKAAGLYPRAELMVGPWYVLGPFPRDGSSSVPLRNIDVTAKFETNEGEATWTAVEGWDDPRQPLDLAPLFKTRENVSAYLFRSIQSPGEASVELRVSADDDFTVWLNGGEVMPRTEDGGAAAWGKNRKRVRLQPGENELVVRVGQAAGAWRLFFDLQPQIDPRVQAKILAEALRVHPDSPGSAAGRVDLAELLISLDLHERALAQAHRVVSDATAPAQSRARADAIIRRYLDIRLDTAQPWNLFTRDELASRTLPVQLTMENRSATTVSGQVAIAIEDVWGEPTARPSPISYTLAPGKALERPLGFEPPGWGAYRVVAETAIGEVPVRGEAVVALVPKPRGGLRPESFFAATTGVNNDDLEAIAKLGIKVTRAIFCNYRWAFRDVSPDREPLPAQYDFTRLDEAVAKHKQLGLSILPVVGDARPRENSVARRLDATGPPMSAQEFTSVTLEIVKHLPDVKYWDLWGDPEIYGPTWADHARAFRSLLKRWSAKTRLVRPDVRVVAGGRPSFFLDIIAAEKNAVAAIDVLSNCARHDGAAASWRSGAQLRFMDFAVQEAARHDEIGKTFLTDSGTDRSRGRPGLTDAHRADAAKVIKLHVLAGLAGNFQANVSQDQGWGAAFPVGNAAYAVMTHLLEDRPVVADVWPAHPLIWGAVFAHPRHVTEAVKALPRSDALADRWETPIPEERKDDATKVAVVWSQTGTDPAHLDENGTLTIRPAGDLRALDMMGRPVGEKKGDALTVPFGPYPVYLLSDALDVVELRKRIARGRIDDVTPVNSYLFSLPRPLDDGPATLTTRVQNQMNRAVKGSIALAGPPGWTIEPTSQPIALKSAELAEVAFRVTATTPSALNQYLVSTRIDTDAGAFERTEVVSVACVVPMTPQVDGKVDEWTAVPFARMDVQQLEAPEVYQQWLRDPRQPRPPLPAGDAFVGVKLAAAYDDKNVYLAAVVREPGLGNDTNGLSSAGNHGENPMTNGDCLEFAFGFREQDENDYRKPDEPWFWKGMFRDTDYVVVQTRQRADQPVLLSLCCPGFLWRTDFQTEKVNTFDLLHGALDAQSRFVRDEAAQTTTYEIALPRRYLKLFDPAQSHFRMGFVYFNDEKLPPLQWARAAGVFDYWTNFGSFLPAWQPFLACQTRWGIVRK